METTGKQLNKTQFPTQYTPRNMPKPHTLETTTSYIIIVPLL